MRSKNATCDEGENEDKWKRCEHEQVQQFVDKVCKLEVSGCHVKQWCIIEKNWHSFPGTPPIAWKLLVYPPPFRISNDLLWEW